MPNSTASPGMHALSHANKCTPVLVVRTLSAANVVRMLQTDTPTIASWDGPSRYSSRLSGMHIR